MPLDGRLRERSPLPMPYLLVILLFVSTIIASGVSVAKPATYEGADLDKAAQILSQHTPPEISRKVISELQDWIDAEKKSRKTQLIVNRLEDLQEEWRTASERMDQELQKVVKQAKRDSVFRAWAGFFRFVATTAEQVAALKALHGKSRPKTQGDAQADDLSAAPSPGKGDVMEVERGKKDIFREKGGQWQRTESHEFIYRHIYRSEGVGKPTGTGTSDGSGGSVGSIVQGMGNTATAYLQKLAEAGVVPYCSDKWEGCALVKEGGDDSWQPPGVLAEIPYGDLERPPTEEEKHLYRSFRENISKYGPLGASIGADMTPGVGDVKGVVEGVTGKDAITGEKIGWVWRIMGAVPAVGARLKAGKNIAKVLKTARGGGRLVLKGVGKLTGRQEVLLERITKAAERGEKSLNKVPSGTTKKDLYESGFSWVCRGAKSCNPYYGKTRSGKGDALVNEIPNTRYTKENGDVFAQYRRIRIEEAKNGRSVNLNAEVVNLNTRKQNTWVGKGAQSERNLHVEIPKMIEP